jgi:DNA-binding transcriptional regulator YbjK
MTPSRRRGRPRSEERRDAVLKAAMELMQEDDLRRASIDRGFFMAKGSRVPAGALGTDQLRQSCTPGPTDREQR